MKNDNLKWILLAFLGILWGSSFILMQLALRGVSSVQLGSLRILFAGIFLLLVGFRQLAKIPSYKWKYIALSAFCGTFIPAYLFSLALSKVNGSLSSILNSLTPLNALLTGVLFFGGLVERKQFFGVILGFIGCVLLILFGNNEGSTENYYYTLLILIASFFYGLNVNLIKKYLSDTKPFSITVGNFAVMIIPAFLMLYFSGFFTTLPDGGKELQVALLWVAALGVIGTAICNILFFKLIQISSPVFASFVTYIIPVVALFLGYIFMNETLNYIQLTGALVVLFGVYFSNKK